MQGKAPCLGQDKTLHHCKRLSPLPCMTAVTSWGHHRVSGSLPQHRRGGCCPRSVVPVCSRCRGNISTVIPLWLWCKHRYMLLSSPHFHPEKHYLVGGDLNMLESRYKKYWSCFQVQKLYSTPHQMLYLQHKWRNREQCLERLLITSHSCLKQESNTTYCCPFWNIQYHWWSLMIRDFLSQTVACRNRFLLPARLLQNI